MPSIREQSTIKALATAFLSNGLKQEQAMIEVGYTPAYANSYCGKMWDNVQLKVEIGRIQAEMAEESNLKIKTRLERQAYWSNAMDGKDLQGNDITMTMSDKLRASELLGKSKADFIDVVRGENKVLSINVNVKEDE